VPDAQTLTKARRRAASKKILTADLRPTLAPARRGPSLESAQREGGGRIKTSADSVQAGEALMKSRFVLWDGKPKI
jgi:hypothetical protein